MSDRRLRAGIPSEGRRGARLGGGRARLRRARAGRRPRRHVRPVVAAAVVAAVVAAVLSPPGRAVVRLAARGDRRRAGRAGAASRCPHPGDLLVTSRRAALARPSRRLEAAARRLPRRVVVAARPLHRRRRGRTSSSRSSPTGTVRWTLARPALAFPPGPARDRHAHRVPLRRQPARWSRATAPATRTSRVPRPSHRPGGRRAGRVLAYADGRSAVVYDVTSGSVLLRTPPIIEAVHKLAWSRDGARLLVFAPHETRVYRGGRVREQDDPSDATLDTDAAFAGGEAAPRRFELPASAATSSGSQAVP